MPTVELSPQLRRFFPGLQESLGVEAGSVAEVVRALEQTREGISGYIVDEHGSLRPHVNVFVNGNLIRDRTHLTDAVGPIDSVLIIQALSGG